MANKQKFAKEWATAKPHHSLKATPILSAKCRATPFPSRWVLATALIFVWCIFSLVSLVLFCWVHYEIIFCLLWSYCSIEDLLYVSPRHTILIIRNNYEHIWHGITTSNTFRAWFFSKQVYLFSISTHVHSHNTFIGIRYMIWTTYWFVFKRAFKDVLAHAFCSRKDIV